MSEAQNDQERPCLHCMMVELIDDFFAAYPSEPTESDKVDTGEAGEVIDAIAKLVAELTCRQDGAIRQQMIEQLMQEIMKYDGEFRREDVAGAIGSTRGTNECQLCMFSGERSITTLVASERNLLMQSSVSNPSLRIRFGLSNFHIAVRILLPEFQAHLQRFEEAQMSIGIGTGPLIGIQKGPP
jgi:hypothetical protein